MNPQPIEAREPHEVPKGAGYEVVWQPDPEATDPSGDLPERFELARDFGDGCAGPVFGVRDRESDGKLVRLEVVAARLTGTEEAQTLLQDELRDARRLVSAHIVRTRDVGRLADGRFFVVSDVVDGESLRTRLQREGELHPREALLIARQTLLGLASAHELQVAHGALDSARIWLAGGTAKDDDDPHGTAVRITDFGLARFVARADGGIVGDASADVRAVGALLREMTGADDVAAEVAACASGSLSAGEAAVAIERALRRGTSRSAPAWARPALLALAAVAAIEAVLLWRTRTEVQARGLGAGAADVQLSEQLSDATRREESLAGELRAAQAQRERELAVSDAQLRDQAALAARLALDLEASARALEEAHGEAQEAQRSARAAEQRASAVEAQNAAQEREATPAARAARGFDATLDAVLAGRGGEAERRVAALEGEGVTGMALARDLAAAAAALESFDASRADALPDVAALRRAGLALASADKSREAFARDARAWSDHALPGESAPPRSERADAALFALRNAYADARVVAAAADVADGQRFAESPGLQDPRAAFEHAERFGCEHASGLGARFAAELRAWVLIGGALDVQRLASFQHLGAWCERLRAGGVTLADSTARELELLAFAQRWYDSDPDNDEGFDWGAVELGSVVGARKDWRNELHLQWRLAQPDSGYPIRPGATLIYRAVDAQGALEWWRETAQSAAPGEWRVRRERLSADALGAAGDGELRIERHGAHFVIPGATQPLLDLRANGDEVLAATCPPTYSGALPAALGVDADELAAFREQRDRELYLVFVRGDVRRWISPRLGLLREESRTARGWFARELVFATPQP